MINVTYFSRNSITNLKTIYIEIIKKNSLLFFLRRKKKVYLIKKNREINSNNLRRYVVYLRPQGWVANKINNQLYKKIRLQ